MQTQKPLVSNNKIKKSHTLLVGSLFIFLGILSLTWDYFVRMRDEVFSDMRIAMMGVEYPVEANSIEATVTSEVQNVPVAEEVKEEAPKNYVIDYSKYTGVLEIPKIGLKRGFYNVGSRYNDIQYNVAVVEGSTMPDVVNGNLILMAHSGDAYISYFAYLYKLNVGDDCYVTYNGLQFHYKIVNIYEVEKTGVVRITRNYDRTTLTMITCTKGNDHAQTVYISELVD